MSSLPSRRTRQIKRLEDQGLVARALGPDDRRCVVVSITDTGKTLVGQAMITYANEFPTPISLRH